MDIDYIDIVDNENQISQPVKKPKFVQPYVSSKQIENKNKDDYIINDEIEPTTFKPNQTNIKVMYPHDELNTVYKYNDDVKCHIKTIQKFKQDDTLDFGYLKSSSNKCRLWFNDEHNPETLIWVISDKLPETNKQSTHTIKNGTKYLNNSLDLSDTEYTWNIINNGGWYYIMTNDLYLTCNEKRYRFPDSITLQPLDNNPDTSKRLKQLWMIVPDPTTFTRKNLEQVMQHTNKTYIEQFMETVPPMEKLKLYAQIASNPTEKVERLKQLAMTLPPNERASIVEEIKKTEQLNPTPDGVIFLRLMTNNFLQRNPFIDVYNAIQYVSKYLSNEAEKVREDLKPKYIQGGKLLRSMYEQEMKTNPNQNKKSALKKCIDSIMEP
jgi:hypothetical protein